MTLEEYRQRFGWSIGEMARLANIDYGTMKRALDGEGVSARTARSLARMLSKETGRTIQWNEIQGLNANV